VAWLAWLAAALVVVPAADASYPAIQAHRGGPLVNGVPRFPENTLPAFRHAAHAEHAVLELDVKLTKDDVPVVIHDDTPDRTTTCDERRAVRSYTLAELRRCRADVLGTPGSTPTRRVVGSTVRIPTLAQVLRLARRTRARVNLEIKNLPTDNDFDPTAAFADHVIDAIARSQLPHGRLIVPPPRCERPRAQGSTSSSRTTRRWRGGHSGPSGWRTRACRHPRHGPGAAACVPTARYRWSRTSTRVAEPRACSPCSSSRRCAMSAAMPLSGRRSSA
jgi:hypothetical protein